MKELVEMRVASTQVEEFIDITERVKQALAETGVSEGICHVFTPHTTCGLLITERADPHVARDIGYALNFMIPSSGYRHSEGNSPAHVKAALVGVSLSLIVIGGKVQLGTWQGIFLCEFDGPRERRVWIKAIAG